MSKDTGIGGISFFFFAKSKNSNLLYPAKKNVFSNPLAGKKLQSFGDFEIKNHEDSLYFSEVHALNQK